MTAVLEVLGLTVQYGGVTAVDDVSLNVEPGEIVGLIGPNGAGKTSLIDAISGFTLHSGVVRVKDHDVQGLPPHRRSRAGLGRSFQSLELFDDLTVRENLAVAGRDARWWTMLSDLVRPRSSASSREAVDKALECFDLTHVSDRHPPELPHGMRSVVSAARALAAEPALLLLDEPAAGLDSDETAALSGQLRDIAADGSSILLVDHDMSLVFSLSDRVYVMNFGRLIAEGSPADVRHDPAVVSAYLGTEEVGA